MEGEHPHVHDVNKPCHALATKTEGTGHTEIKQIQSTKTYRMTRFKKYSFTARTSSNLGAFLVFTYLQFDLFLYALAEI